MSEVCACAAAGVTSLAQPVSELCTQNTTTTPRLPPACYLGNAPAPNAAERDDASARCHAGAVAAASDRREARRPQQRLVRQQLDHGRRREAAPDGQEAAVESERALVLQRLADGVEEAVVEPGVGGLVHELGAHHVERRHRARHHEARDDGRHEHRADVLARPPRVLDDHALRHVVARHLGAVEHHGAHRVGLHASVKALDALVRVHLLCQLRQRHLLRVRLHHRLHHVEGVADDGAQAA
mmetsp:Transcript_11803/g.41330  ORF Transcript_11803/g.41330 Transcript_11803/m.41330 type:complete len:241 (+) Transcript_11803:3373-4095(+)